MTLRDFISPQQSPTQQQRNHLQKPSKILTIRPIPQPLRRNIPRPPLDALSQIPPPIIPHHPRPQPQRQQNPHTPKPRRRGQRRNIIRSVLRPKNITTHHPHHIRHGNSNTRQQHPPRFVCNVIIIPHVQNNTRSRCAPRHHEARKIRHM